MRVWLAIDGDGAPWLFPRKPEWCGQHWADIDGGPGGSDWAFRFEGPLPFAIAPGECREVELRLAEVDQASLAPRLPERATTKTGRNA